MMSDLGPSMKVVNGGLADGQLFWRQFKVIMNLTRQRVSGAMAQKNCSVEELIFHLQRFVQPKTSSLVNLIRENCPAVDNDWATLMLLDFTPDNLFLKPQSISFLDPWRQSTYLGNPAIGFGQFITLIQLYDMFEARETADYLRNRCLQELPEILKTDTEKISLALRLGETLQLALSSFVRLKSDPVYADNLFRRAIKLWIT